VLRIDFIIFKECIQWILLISQKEKSAAATLMNLTDVMLIKISQNQKKTWYEDSLYMNV
jgi:hypothetical protein